MKRKEKKKLILICKSKPYKIFARKISCSSPATHYFGVYSTQKLGEIRHKCLYIYNVYIGIDFSFLFIE